MYTRVLGLTISAIILVYCAVGAIAQDRMMTQPDQQQVQSQPMGQEGASSMGMGQGCMMGGRMMGRGMMGGAMEGPMMRIIFALMDSDGDGTVSLQEFQAAHERIFKAMDANKDGVLTLEEIQSFMSGQSGSGPRQ